MFLLSFIPDALLVYVVNAIVVIGLAGTTVSVLFKFFIRWMPWIIPYRALFQFVSVLFVVVGVYFKGGYDTEMEWRNRVKEAEEKVKIAEAKAKEANEQLSQEKKNKVKVITDNKVVIEKRITEQQQVIDADCKVSQSAIDILNAAAQRPGAKK